jgi:hypothetical protein
MVRLSLMCGVAHGHNLSFWNIATIEVSLSPRWPFSKGIHVIFPSTANSSSFLHRYIPGALSISFFLP